MKKYKFYLTVVLLISIYSNIASQTVSGEKLKRSDSFFGLHFDFHAKSEDKEIGKYLTEGMIDSLLILVKPDYIQIDCKGHAGYSSYPTRVGHQAGGFVKDPIKLFREVTDRYNIALYVHYSGVWDEAALQSNPHWSRIDNKGNRDPQKISFYSNYTDSLMIPQLKELSKEYEIDGAWVDGDCWATVPDYSPEASSAFLAETGLAVMPLSPSDPGYSELLEFTRRNFRKYVSHYVDAIHAFDPGFEITSNWAYTGFMPEPVTIDLDFISGDLSAQNGVYSAAFEARCIAPQGKAWDLMGWSFAYRFSDRFRTQKTALQMQQEASQVLALGGGFQKYYSQNRDASLQRWTYSSMASVAEFCRDRQKYCHRGITIPKAVILYSSHGFKMQSTRVYSEDAAREVKGVMMMMLDAQYSVEIKSEHHLTGKLQEYGLVVIPGWEFLEESFQQELMDYAERGGNLLLLGPGPLHLFGKNLPVEIVEVQPESIFFMGYENQMGSVKSQFAKVKSVGSSSGRFYDVQDFNSLSYPASVLTNYGNGKIGAIFCNLGNSYINERVDILKAYFREFVGQMYAPDIKVTSSGNLHIHLTEKDGKQYLHLLNAGGPHNNPNVFQYDLLEKIRAIEVKYQIPQRPTNLIVRPENTSVPFQYNAGWVSFTIPEIEIYSIIEID